MLHSSLVTSRDTSCYQKRALANSGLTQIGRITSRRSACCILPMSMIVACSTNTVQNSSSLLMVFCLLETRSCDNLERVWCFEYSLFKCLSSGWSFVPNPSRIGLKLICWIMRVRLNESLPLNESGRPNPQIMSLQ